MIGASTTRARAILEIALRFAAQNVDSPEREARLVAAAAAGLRMIDLIVEPEIPLAAAAERVEAFARRREAGEPLSRILGRREFWSLSLEVSPDVLDPRPDTETIIEAAFDEFAQRRHDPLRIVDFGVGSGAILAALLQEFPKATGLGIDRSPVAAEMARRNLAALGFATRSSVRVGDWGAGLEGPYDLVVSNPPYIPTEDIATLAREVRDYDPLLALDGGADGLDAYRGLAPHVVRLLAPDGRFVFEHGEGQSADLEKVLRSAGLEPLSSRDDLGGVERVVIGRRAGLSAG